MGFTDVLKLYFKKFNSFIPYLIIKIFFNIALIKFSLNISDIQKLFNVSDGKYVLDNPKQSIILILLILAVNIILDPMFYCFLGVISRNVLKKQDVNQIEAFKESFSYLIRYIGLTIAIGVIVLGITAIFGVLSVIAIIPVLEVILLIAGIVLLVATVIMFSSCGEYLIYNNCKITQALNNGRLVGKKFFGQILLLILCVSLLGYPLRYNLNYFIYFIILLIDVMGDTFASLYRMNLCKVYNEEKEEEPIIV